MSWWREASCLRPVELNKHARKVDNTGPLNMKTCFGIEVASEKVWLCSGCRRNFGRHKRSGGVKTYMSKRSTPIAPNSLASSSKTALVDSSEKRRCKERETVLKAKRSRGVPSKRSVSASPSLASADQGARASSWLVTWLGFVLTSAARRNAGRCSEHDDAAQQLSNIARLWSPSAHSRALRCRVSRDRLLLCPDDFAAPGFLTPLDELTQSLMLNGTASSPALMPLSAGAFTNSLMCLQGSLAQTSAPQHSASILRPAAFEGDKDTALFRCLAVHSIRRDFRSARDLRTRFTERLCRSPVPGRFLSSFCPR